VTESLSFIAEEKVTLDCAKYIFMNEQIPINKFDSYDVDEVESTSPHVSFEPDQVGFTVKIFNNVGINGSMFIPDTNEFMNKDVDGLFSQYLSLLNNAIRVKSK
jgi:hypothetical protein